MAYTTINKSTDYFNTKLYSGTGSSQSITGVGHQPDFVWIKCRSGTYATEEHNLFDRVRGTTKFVRSSSASAELTDTNSLSAFNSDGFTVVSRDSINGSSSAYASWNWKANGQGSQNTDGSINTTYTSANTTAGFSIVKWTSTDTAGSTIGHGLGAVPKMIITKKITSGNPGNWTVYHNSIGNTKSLALNTTGVEDAATSYWNNTSPTASVFSTGTYFDAGDYIAYCFAEKQGYSKFGQYIGNGSSSGDGTFVFTGMKPAFIMIKATSGSENWQMYDNKRLGYNVDNNMLRANLSNAEQTDNDIDILSNGFKLRRNSGAFNSSGSTYIYMAFAEAPLVGSNNVPCTAR